MSGRSRHSVLRFAALLGLVLAATAVSADDTRAPEALQSFIQAALNGDSGVRACLEPVYAQAPQTPQALLLRLRIDRYGVVTLARVESGTFEDPAVHRCVTEQVARWRFPGRAASEVELLYTLDFRWFWPELGTVGNLMFDGESIETGSIQLLATDAVSADVTSTDAAPLPAEPAPLPPVTVPPTAPAAPESTTWPRWLLALIAGVLLLRLVRILIQRRERNRK